ncbi:MAG: chemotaxis protein CheW [Pseudomonadota bacterium]
MSSVEKIVENAPAHDGQFLSFTLGGEHYGVDILRVQEIKGWEEVRPLPDTPDFIKGVLDLRGVIVPIIDLRSRFNFASVEYTPTTVTIVLSVERAGKPLIVGVVVDGVSDVLNVKSSEMREAPDLGAQINTRYITGIFTQNGRMVVLLDVDKLFNPDELGLPENIA